MIGHTNTMTTNFQYNFDQINLIQLASFRVAVILSCLLGVSCIWTVNSSSNSVNGTSLYNISQPLHQRKLSKKNTVYGSLPTIFISGVQKGGSSSLFELMVSHPQLCGGMHKESHFFDKAENYNKGIDHYKSLYHDKKCSSKKKATYYIDGTPMIHYTNVWEKVYNTYSEDVELRDRLKFIVLLREPVSRDYSWYEHAVRSNLHEGLDFESVKTPAELYQGSSSNHRKGRYLEQLQAFVKYFKRSQIFIISSAAIFEKPLEILDRIRRFIDVTPDESFLQSLPHDAHLGSILKAGIGDCIIGHIPKLDCTVRDQMGEYYEPLNQQLYEWILETKKDADKNEPPFWPTFDNYKALPCVADARAEYDIVIRADWALEPPRTVCVENDQLDPGDLYNPL